jgi:CheY-like chemotaxis protein
MNAPEESLHVSTAGSAIVKIARPLREGTQVLIVEDDVDNVALLRAYLGDTPLSLDFALNGLEALGKRRRGDHALILMDMQMPVMDGYAATREIRAWEKANGKRRVPIMALTAHAVNGALGNSLEAGCDAHLTKPVQRGVLLDAIAEYARPGGEEEPTSTEITLRTTPAADGGISDSIKARRPAFLANRWRDLEKLRSSLAALDFPAIRTIAHNCKGIGTGYGFPEISNLGLQISTAAKAFDTDKLQEHFSTFEGCLRAAA